MEPPTLSRRQLLLSAALLFPLAGCGPSGTSSGGGTASAGSRRLVTATADDIQSLDSALAFDTWTTSVVHAVTRRLVDYDDEGSLVGDLAETWDIADDGKTYTFHLREARYADGTPIVAADFIRALERVRDPATASPGLDFYRHIDTLEAPDERTLVVRLSAPEPTLLNVLGMTFAAPVPEGYDPRRPVGSGPYTVEAFEPGMQVVLRRNPEDGANPSRLEEVVVQLRVEESLQWTRFQAGEIDLLPSLPAAEYGRVMGDPSLKRNVVQGVVNQTWYFGMNLTRRPWSNPSVRQAALLALNRPRHVQLAGSGQLANGILPPHVPGYAPERALPERDLAAAKRLLAEAGYPNGVPESEKTVLWLANNDAYQRHAAAIQSDLAEIGIPVDLRPVTFSEYRTGYRTHADCWYGGYYPDFPDAGNFLEPVLHGRNVRTGTSPNSARYSNPRFDRLLDQAHATPLGPERSRLYREAEDVLLADLPWIPLYFEVETRFFRDGVTGVKVHPVWRQMLTGIDRA